MLKINKPRKIINLVKKSIIVTMVDYNIDIPINI